MKKYFFALILAVFLNAETVDRIVASVEGLAVTSYDVEEFAKNHHISQKEALNALIDKKLIESEIKKRGISVDDFEIEEEMEKIAKQNGMNLFEFKSILAQRGELEKLKKEIKENLLRKKLFSDIIQTKLKISESDLKDYYNTHKDEFTVFDSIQLIKYSANNPEILKKIKINPLISSPIITSKSLVLTSDEMPLRMLFLFKHLKEGEYSPIVNEGMSYSMYYVVKKNGKKLLPFEKVKNLIYAKLIKEKQEIILKNYFERLKNRADIEVFN